MIHTNRIVTVGDQESIIDRPIVLYRGDREVEIEFTLVGNEFSFSEEGNVIKSVNASHGQLVLNTPSGEHMFSELAECHEGKVVFIVTKEMIDEFVEVGFYSFQIRLYDSAEMKSRVTIPPVMNGFDIRNPIAAEDETNVVDQGIVDYARIFKDQSNEELPTFTWDGEYNKTEWVHHDVITENKLNKIEDALYSINANVKESDVVMLNTLDKVKKDADKYVKEHMAEVEADVDEFERNLNTEVEMFKVDTNAAMTAHKNEVNNKVNVITDEVGGLNYRNLIPDKQITNIEKWNKTGNIVTISNSLSNGIRINNTSGSATQSISCPIPLKSLLDGEYYLSLKRLANTGNISSKISVTVGKISKTTGLFGGYTNIISDNSNTTEGFSERTFVLNKESLLSQYPEATHIAINSSIPAGCDLTHYEFYLSLNSVVNKNYKIEGNILNKATKNRLHKKTMYYDGDSIAYGAGSDGKGFGDIIAERNGMIINKYAISGATLSVFEAENRHNICTSVINNFNGEDIALIEGGFNDFGNGIEFGTLSTDVRVPLSSNPNNETIVGAMEQIFQHIQKTSPQTKIYFVIVHKANNSYTKPLSSSGKTFTEVHDLMCSVCDRYAVEVIDIFKNSGFNTFYDEHKVYTKDNDGIHPNEGGYEIFYVPQCEKHMC